MSLPISAAASGDFHAEFSLTNDAADWIEIADITVEDPTVASFCKMRIEGSPNVTAARVTISTTDGYPITCPGMPGERGEAKWFDSSEGNSDAGHLSQPIPTEEASDGQVVITIPGGANGFLDTILWINNGGATSFTIEIFGETGGHGLVRGALRADRRPNGWI